MILSNRNKEKIEIGARAITASIPYIGGAINSVLNDINANRKFERFEKFIEQLRDDIQEIKNINEDFINKDDFLDLFEQTSRYIMSERLETKRNMFKNILKNSISISSADYDKTEKYLKILSDLSLIDIQLLKVLKNPIKFNEENGNKIVNSNDSRFATKWENINMMDLLKKLFHDIPEDDIEESAFFIESQRLTVRNFDKQSLYTNGHPISILEHKLTNKGKDFLDYIIE